VLRIRGPAIKEAEKQGNKGGEGRKEGRRKSV